MRFRAMLLMEQRVLCLKINTGNVCDAAIRLLRPASFVRRSAADIIF